jgi:hypothetical protein
MKDLVSQIGLVQVFGPAVIAADATAVVTDLQGYHSAVVEVAIGVGGITFDSTNKIEFKLEHSDNGTDYTDVTAADLAGDDVPATVTTGYFLSLVAAHAAATVQKFGYIGGKRYLRHDIEFSGTHGTGTPISVTLVKGDAELQPVA